MCVWTKKSTGDGYWSVNSVKHSSAWGFLSCQRVLTHRAERLSLWLAAQLSARGEKQKWGKSFVLSASGCGVNVLTGVLNPSCSSSCWWWVDEMKSYFLSCRRRMYLLVGCSLCDVFKCSLARTQVTWCDTAVGLRQVRSLIWVCLKWSVVSAGRCVRSLSFVSLKTWRKEIFLHTFSSLSRQTRLYAWIQVLPFKLRVVQLLTRCKTHFLQITAGLVQINP